MIEKALCCQHRGSNTPGNKVLFLSYPADSKKFAFYSNSYKYLYWCIAKKTISIESDSTHSIQKDTQGE